MPQFVSIAELFKGRHFAQEIVVLCVRWNGGCEAAAVRVSVARIARGLEVKIGQQAMENRIQRIALHFPAYGRPRITAELKRQGWDVNHKRVGRILLGRQTVLFTEAQVSTDYGLPSLLPDLSQSGA